MHKNKGCDEKSLLKQLIKESIKKQILYEGYLYSYPISVVTRGITKIGYKHLYNNKSITIQFILSNDNITNYEKLNSFLENTCGWHHRASISPNKSQLKNKLDFMNTNEGFVILQYEPKFDVEIKNNKELLYHITTLDKLKKIQKNGLSPKSNHLFFSFNNRIFFTTQKDSLYEFVNKKFQILSINDKKTNSFVILEINIKNNVRLFRDPNLETGLYTLENISPYYIKPIEIINVDDNGKINNISKYK